MKKSEFLKTAQENYAFRFHMVLILGATTLSGIILNVLMLNLGLTNMVVRYPVAVLGAYLAFFFWLKTWFVLAIDLAPVTNPVGNNFSPNAGDVLDGVDFATQMISESASTSGNIPVPPSAPADASISGSDVASVAGGLDEGAIVLLVIGTLVAILAALGGYMVYEAPEILSETLFQMAIGAGLLKGTQKTIPADWIGTVFSMTCKYMVMAVFVGFLIGNVALGACPSATRMSEVIAHCQNSPMHKNCAHHAATKGVQRAQLPETNPSR